MNTPLRKAPPSEETSLSRLAAGRVVILGVGNVLRGDDGAGPALIARLKGHGFAHAIDAGPVPENQVGPVLRANPGAVVLVDAVDLGLPPGSWRLFHWAELAESGLTTHTAPLSLFVHYLLTRIQVPVHIIGIQPETLEFGADLSPAVRDTVEKLAELVSGL